jgi:hypothetical protein
MEVVAVASSAGGLAAGSAFAPPPPSTAGPGHHGILLHDVVGDILGVAGQQAGLGDAAGRAELIEEFGVLDGELESLVGHIVFAEDRLDRTDRLAGAQSTHSSGWM